MLSYVWPMRFKVAKSVDITMYVIHVFLNVILSGGSLGETSSDAQCSQEQKNRELSKRTSCNKYIRTRLLCMGTDALHKSHIASVYLHTTT